MLPAVSVPTLPVPAATAEEPTGFLSRIQAHLRNMFQGIKNSLISCFVYICWWHDEEMSDVQGSFNYLDTDFQPEHDAIMNACISMNNTNACQGFYGEPSTSDVQLSAKDRKNRENELKAAKEADRAFQKAYREYVKYEKERSQWSAGQVQYVEDIIPSCAWPHAYHVQLRSFRPVLNDLNVLVHTESAVEHL